MFEKNFSFATLIYNVCIIYYSLSRAQKKLQITYRLFIKPRSEAHPSPLLTLTPAVQTNSSLLCSLDFNRLLLSVLFKICINDPQAINIPSWTIKFYINNVSLFEPCRQFCCLLLWFFFSSFRKNFSITFFQIIQIPQMQDYTEKEPRWLKMDKIYKWIKTSGKSTDSDETPF